ncbi:MAG TPA: ABC transporter permease [Candidatus Aphodousia gallistercoris]|nr:ABC transporter permease [Candidatus Aphodousia gallistercoris]
MSNGILASIREEVGAMMSGRFVPFHILSVLVGLVVTVFFSLILPNNTVYDGRLAVIDLDHSQTSTSLIEMIDASNRIRVTDVVHGPVNPKRLLAHDSNLAVLYIPKRFEEKLIKGDASQTLGFFADNTNTAQYVHVLEELQEIIPESTASLSVAAVSALGTSAEQTEAILQPATLSTRYLFNAASSNTNITLIGFLCFFPSIYIGITMLMIVGRLHISGLWEEALLKRTPAAMIARLVPYAFFYTASITFFMGILATLNDLRFVGNILLFFPCLFTTALAIGMLAFFLTWHHTSPAGGAAFMIFIVPPGFIMGGTTMPVVTLPDWVYHFSYCFPLTWLYRFFRDIGLRGETLSSMLPTYGAYLIYLALIALAVTVRFYRSRKALAELKEDIKNTDLTPAHV